MKQNELHLNETRERMRKWKNRSCITEQKKKDSSFLPDPASMMLDCPLRSGTSRDELGMLTGSERTGWILHMYSVRAVLHTQRQLTYRLTATSNGSKGHSKK